MSQLALRSIAAIRQSFVTSPCVTCLIDIHTRQMSTRPSWADTCRMWKWYLTYETVSVIRKYDRIINGIVPPTMVTSWHRNTFFNFGFLRGKSTSHRWISLTIPAMQSFDVFLFLARKRWIYRCVVGAETLMGSHCHAHPTKESNTLS